MGSAKGFFLNGHPLVEPRARNQECSAPSLSQKNICVLLCHLIGQKDMFSFARKAYPSRFSPHQHSATRVGFSC
jgi:hypothetical protein